MDFFVNNLPLKELAFGYLEGGLSLVPCNPNTKRPASEMLPKDPETGSGVWKPFQKRPPTRDEVDGWFSKGCMSIAAIGGEVSHNLMIIDFDELRFFDAWIAAVGTLADGIPLQRTGRENGGYQVYFRCDKPLGNEKLAWLADNSQEDGRRVAIETKGEGGYAILPGSLHPSGRLYQKLSGDFRNIPHIPQERADVLIEEARKLDEMPFTKQQIETTENTAVRSSSYSSNGDSKAIDYYNEARTIHEVLRESGYKKVGDRYVRPNGKSPSVGIVDDKYSYHWSSNDPLGDGHTHDAFDVYCKYQHKGNCREAVKEVIEFFQIGEEHKLQVDPTPIINQSVGERRTKTTTNENGNELVTTEIVRDTTQDNLPLYAKLIDSAELESWDVQPEFLVNNILVKGQPSIFGGRSKTLKTGLVIDLAVSLGSGTPFLGQFNSTKCRVAVWSGESGIAAIRNTAMRVAEAKNVRLSDCDIFWAFDLPKLSRDIELDDIKKIIEKRKIDVAVFDPLYLCLLGGNESQGAGNVYFMGSKLIGLSQLAQKTGVTPIVLHHFKKSQSDENEPCTLEDLSQAGAAEWCRQWLLLARAETYQNDGTHKLFMRSGGSAGFGGLYRVDVDEGTIDGTDFSSGRKWDTSVHPAGDYHGEMKKRQDQRKAERQEALEAEHRQRLFATLKNHPNGDTTRALRDESGLNSTNFGKAIGTMKKEGRVIACEVTKSRGKYDGFKLKM